MPHLRTAVLLAASLTASWSASATFAQTPATRPAPPLPAAPLTAPLTPAATTAPTTQSAEEKEVRAAMAKYNAAVAAADVPTLTGFLSVSSPAQKQILQVMGRLTASGRAVYDAAVDKLGAADLAKSGIDKTNFPSGYPPMPADDAAIMVNGNKAVMVSRAAAEGAQPINLVKKDGAWTIDGDALLPQMTDKQLNEQTQILDAVIGTLDEMAGDVKAGHFRAADEVILVLNHRVQKAVRAAQAKLPPMDEPTVPSTGPATAPAATPAGPQVP